MADPHDLYIGWAMEDISPLSPVALTGQLYKRISTHIQDPLTATALAIETIGPGGQREQAVMVSCDLIWIRRDIQDRIRQIISLSLPDFNSDKLLLNATHTHTGPGFKDDDFYDLYDTSGDPNVLSATEYGNFLVDRLASVVVQAWNTRSLGGLNWAKTYAVVGHNRRVSFFNGLTTMYGLTNNDQFSHLEGYESHDLDLLFFFDSANNLTGILINIPVPSQVDESASFVSSDFWHEVRQEVSSRYGSAVYVFPQCGAAGDISPRTLLEQAAENRMRQRRGLSVRQEIARRIANAIDDVYSFIEPGIRHKLEFQHIVMDINLTLKNPPAPPFYKTDSPPFEIHCLQLGDVAIATVPFELFLDYGMRIKARSLAQLTLISQLSCEHAGYLPTARAVAGGGYSADKYIVGPQGGQELVNVVVGVINSMYTDVSSNYIQIVESDNSTSVNEQGHLSDSYTIQLLIPPTQDVTVTLNYDSSQLSVAPSILIFTTANWAQPQAVTVAAVDDGLGEGIHTSTISHIIDGGNYDGVTIGPIQVTISETAPATNLIVNGDFELPRVQELPPYWRGWPINWILTSGTVVIDNEPSKWSQAPYNNTLGNQYLVGLPSGEFRQDVASVYMPNTLYILSVDLGTLSGRSNVDYYIQLRDVQTNTVWGHTDQTEFGYPSPGYWNVNAQLSFTTPPGGGPVGNQICVVIGLERAVSGTFSNGICADNVKLFAYDSGSQSGYAYITESDSSTRVDEFSQTTDTYSIVLGIEPTEDVTIAINYDPAQLVVSPPVLLFTSGNWDQPQIITVQAVQDGAGEGTHTSLISHSVSGGIYQGIAMANVSIVIEENYPPQPSVRVIESDNSTQVVEDGQTFDSYTIQLLTQPTESVSVLLTFDNTQITVEPSVLFFDVSNWAQPQTVTVTAVDDGDGEGTHNAVISHSASGGDYEGIAIDSVIVMIEEHVQQINLIVNGNFELPRVQPLPPYWRGWPDNWTLASGTVIIDNEPTKWTVSPYNEPLGNQYLIGLPSGEFYQDVTASFLADKTYRLVVDLGTLGGRPNVDYFIQLRDAQTNTVWAHGDQSNYGYPIAGKWDVKAELTYTAPSADGPVGKPIRVYIGFKNAPSGTYRNGICADNVELFVYDSDSPSGYVTVTESDGSTSVDEFSQTTDTHSIVLGIEPTEDVTIALNYDPAQLVVSPPVLHFTSGNWDQPQIITVQAVQDGAGEGPHTTVISHSAFGGNYEGVAISDVTVSIEENYPSVLVTESDNTTQVDENGPTSDSYTIRLLTRPTESVAISLSFDIGQITVEPEVLFFDATSWEQPQTVMVTAVDDGAGEGTHNTVISHSAFGGNYEGIPISDVTVKIEENGM
jgi:hypothetical protein